MASVQSNLNEIRARIERAAARAGRSASEILLVGVSKTHTPEQIRAAFAAGVRDFGENRVQEYEGKRTSLADLDATWHMVGHLQTNKVAKAAQLFQSIDSVDSVDAITRLDRAAAEHAGLRRGKRLRILLELKLDPVATKSGASEAEMPDLANAALAASHLDVAGLMGVPPYFDDPQQSRPYFQHLRRVRDALCREFGPQMFPILSMGMSHDFEVAIEEGANEIRVGTALFGERSRK